MPKSFNFIVARLIVAVFLMTTILPANVLAVTLESEKHDKALSVENKIDQEGTQISLKEGPAPGSLEAEKIYYGGLMRDIAASKKNASDIDKNKLSADLERFLQQEKERLDGLGVSKKRQDEYFALMQSQKSAANPQTGEMIDQIQGILGVTGEAEPRWEDLKIEIPESPSTFEFHDDEIEIKSIKKGLISAVPQVEVPSKFASLFSLPTANALEDGLLPTILDIQEDGAEVFITQEIRSLAEELQYNPVKIFNYVRNNVDYEPYLGAKKGSAGCLEELVCNDTDTASLTIALMRASGIPARYKKGVAVMTVEQLKDLIGVDETKTAFLALTLNQVPVAVLSDLLVGQTFETADFSAETHLALDWTFVEIFYDYDELGANERNDLNFDEVEDTSELRDLLRSKFNKQWIPVDATIKKYDRIENEIVSDTAAYNADTAWVNFYQYNGDLSPVEKFAYDLKTITGKDVMTADYQSTKVLNEKEFEILPSTLPYAFGSGEAGGGMVIDLETWSVLPDERRYEVKISLLRKDDQSEVLTHTFFGSEINNLPVNLYYEGAEQSDKDVIDSYGGISYTPASLVDIVPYFALGEPLYQPQRGFKRFDTEETVQIGDGLILQFEYFLDGELLGDDQKFSTAGNEEGIYLILSKVSGNLLLDDEENELHNSYVLYEGNDYLAREYLKELEQKGEVLEGALDYDFNFRFVRAVITQNRVLNEVNGTPTSFDFNGLTIDASADIVDYSRRGNYKNHRSDFRLLWGQEGSYYEGQIFDEVAGIEGISTVRGLQYAYANPTEYTIHTINSANQNVINSLQFNSAVKSKMLLDVQDGKTIITPQKPVSKGVFTGVLYVSLSPQKTGTYAIGEQVQNGGLSTTVMTVDISCDSACWNLYRTSSDGNRFFFSPNRTEDLMPEGLKCSIGESAFAKIVMNEGIPDSAPIYMKWSHEYGAPCFKSSLKFADFTHHFIVSSNAFKFAGTKTVNDVEQPVYSYWINSDVASEKLRLEDVGLGIREVTAKLNILTGTPYFYYGSGGVYYQPNEPLLSVSYPEWWLERGGTWKVEGKIFEKLMAPHYAATGSSGNRDWILAKLGYPKGAEMGAVDSRYGGEGTYQPFVGGHIYKEKDLAFDDVYYSPIKIVEKVDEAQYCISGVCGTGGEFGFPKTDPVRVSSDSTVRQRFENESVVIWNTSIGTVSVVDYQKYDCAFYADVNSAFILDLIFLHGIIDSGIQTLDDLASLAGDIIDNLLHFWDIPGDVLDMAKAIIAVAKDISWNKIVSFMAETGSSAWSSLKTQYDQAFVTGCRAKQNYLRGKLVGMAAQIFVPASKLKTLTKMKILARVELAFPRLKILSSGKFKKIHKLMDEQDILDLEYVKALPQTQKGGDGELFWTRFVQNYVRRQKFEIPDPSLTNRFVDVWDEDSGIAYEVKNGSQNFSLSTSISGEIEKDFYLMNNLESYRPVWVFLDSGPSGPLAAKLEESGIEYILLLE